MCASAYTNGHMDFHVCVCICVYDYVCTDTEQCVRKVIFLIHVRPYNQDKTLQPITFLQDQWGDSGGDSFVS